MQPRCSRGAAEVCRLDIPLRADEAARAGPRTLNAMCGSCLSQTWSREGRPALAPAPPFCAWGSGPPLPLPQASRSPSSLGGEVSDDDENDAAPGAS